MGQEQHHCTRLSRYSCCHGKVSFNCNFFPEQYKRTSGVCITCGVMEVARNLDPEDLGLSQPMLPSHETQKTQTLFWGPFLHWATRAGIPHSRED